MPDFEPVECVKLQNLRYWPTFLLAICFLSFNSCSQAPDNGRPSRRAVGVLSRLPLYFEPQPGRIGRGPEFAARTSGASVTLAEGQIRIEPNGKSPKLLTVGFPGAYGPERVEPEERLAGSTHYLKGSDPALWRTGVPHYGRVRWTNLYPGIDVSYYGRAGRLEYDFHVSPGADPSRITLDFKGARSVSIDDNGDLLLQTVWGDVRQPKPHSYQEWDGTRVTVPSEYVILPGDRVGIQLGDYRPEQTLVIDPALDFSSTLGGNGSDVADGIAVDTSGNIYVTGYTDSTNLAVTGGSVQTVAGGNRDVFVAKLSPDGTSLSYLTYIGGSQLDRANGIAVDSSGAVYVAGIAGSGFPVTAGAYRIECCGAFVAKLTAAGDALAYSTFLGSGEVYGIAVDGSGNAYLTGLAYSSFPVTAGALQTTFGGETDAFVSKLDAAGANLTYSTLMGGTNYDRSYGIAINASGEAFVAGYTYSSNFPVSTTAFQRSFGGNVDGFVARLNSAGSALIYSTLLGGTSRDEAHAIAIDSFGTAYTAGMTSSATFPVTAGAYRTVGESGQYSGFVTAVSADGTALEYSTFVGTVTDYFTTRFGIAANSTGSAFVTGSASSGFPTTSDAFQATSGGALDAFVVQLNPAGSDAVYSSYLGGSGDENGRAITIDANGKVYVAGTTLSTNFPATSGSLHSPLSGDSDVFAVRIDSTATSCGYDLSPESEGFPSSGDPGSVGVTTSSGCAWSSSSGASWVTISGGGSGSGSGVVDYTVASNTSTSSRTATLQVAGQSFVVYQAGTAAPNVPNGPSAGISGETYQYSTGGISFVDGGTAEYRFDWGNGSMSGWGNGSASVTWPVQGMYFVSAQARSAQHPQMTTAWSAPLVANILAPSEALSNEAFAEQTYLDILNRSADPASLSAVVGGLSSGALTRQDLVASLIESAEYELNGAFVIRCYLSIMRRAPDFGGWKNWYDAMRAGWTYSQVIDAFVQAPEFTLLYGSLSNADFVTLVYQNVLGREPDPGGYVNWLDQLNAGTLTRGEMMMGFILSAEYTAATKYQVQVETAYLCLLRRASDSAGANAWLGYFGSHPLAKSISYFISSQEYLLRF